MLLEEVPFGPRVARNRFFQVPHCNGMGYRDVRAHAEMRVVKAQGGWAVICTEETEIHHSSEVTPYIEARLWDDADIPALAILTERIHDHGALAGIELAYNGMNGPNLTSRTVPMGPTHLPVAGFADDPVQARAMTRRDIANLRRWHRQAVLRSLQAGFDLVYVYGCRIGRARSSNVARQARLFDRVGRAVPPARRASRQRSPSAEASGLDSSARLPPVPAGSFGSG